MRELIKEACSSNDSKLFSELRETFPLELLIAELAELGEQYQQQFSELNRKWERDWEYRYSVKWHGEWVKGVRLVSPPIESPDSRVRCQAWQFESEAGEKIYAWNEESCRENFPPNLALSERTPTTQQFGQPFEFPPLVGKGVYVTPGTFRTEGEGVVEVDRGYGSFRAVEVRMPERKIQVVSVSDVRLTSVKTQRGHLNEPSF